MTQPCTAELTSLLPAFALDAVDDIERELVREHVAECIECALELARLRVAAHAIDESQPEPGAAVWSRIVDEIRSRPLSEAATFESGAPARAVRTRRKIDAAASTSADVDVLRLTSKAAHELLWIETPEAAAAIVADFVRSLGADVEPLAAGNSDCLLIDISFGVGEPVFPASPHLSMTRLLLEESLPAVMEDARRAIALARERRRHDR
jgi:hypothetical protein